MNALFALLQDTSFWGGAAVLILSIIGVRWILRYLHAQPDESDMMSDEEPEMPPPARPSSRIQPAADLTTRSVETPSGDISQRLDRIEQALSQIQQKLSQPGAKPGAPAPQMEQISSKIDKIYQVLAQLSNEDTPK